MPAWPSGRCAFCAAAGQRLRVWDKEWRQGRGRACRNQWARGQEPQGWRLSLASSGKSPFWAFVTPGQCADAAAQRSRDGPGEALPCLVPVKPSKGRLALPLLQVLGPEERAQLCGIGVTVMTPRRPAPVHSLSLAQLSADSSVLERRAEQRSPPWGTLPSWGVLTMV